VNEKALTHWGPVAPKLKKKVGPKLLYFLPFQTKLSENLNMLSFSYIHNFCCLFFTKTRSNVATVRNAFTFDDALNDSTFTFSSCDVPCYRYICCIGIQDWKFLSPKKFGIPWLILMFDDNISLKDVRRCSRTLFVLGKCFLSPEY